MIWLCGIENQSMYLSYYIIMRDYTGTDVEGEIFPT
jgi:hypothetical protein